MGLTEFRNDDFPQVTVFVNGGKLSEEQIARVNSAISKILSAEGGTESARVESADLPGTIHCAGGDDSVDTDPVRLTTMNTLWGFLIAKGWKALKEKYLVACPKCAKRFKDKGVLE